MKVNAEAIRTSMEIDTNKYTGTRYKWKPSWPLTMALVTGLLYVAYWMGIVWGS